MSRVPELARNARHAARALARLDGNARSALLRDLATRLEDAHTVESLVAANNKDLEAAQAAAKAGNLAQALVKRLGLSSSKLASLSEGLRQLAAMPELVGQRDIHRELDKGLDLERVRTPLGVLGIVFEARPDAVVQISGLALKSGNAVLLKGGSEALNSNRALVALIHELLDAHRVDRACVSLLEDRAEFQALLDCRADVDLIIARGSGAFVSMVMKSTDIPVMGHAEGLCHIYLHEDADPEMAAGIVTDAKVSYPAACNSVETLLWHGDAGGALDATLASLRAEGVELRGCEATRARHPNLVAASDLDWSSEYTDLILSVARVDDLDAALEHIARYGSKHTEAIVSASSQAAERFLDEVDAASVFHNASTRFADGFRYGLGAEVGVSTGKLHARGPVGVEGLFTYRWRLRGEGQVSRDYGPGGRAFTHQDLDE